MVDAITGCRATSPTSCRRWSPRVSRPTWTARAITGHSMGGHGALTLALRNPGRYRSVSAFAPIVAPSQVPWGEKALGRYLGADRAAWRAHDAVALIEDGARVAELLVDHGRRPTISSTSSCGPSCSKRPAPTAGIPLTLRLPAGLRPQLLFHLDLHGRPSALARGAASLNADLVPPGAVASPTALACGLLIGIERGWKLRGLEPGTRVAGRPHLLDARPRRRDRRADRRRSAMPLVAAAIVAGAVAVHGRLAYAPGLENGPIRPAPSRRWSPSRSASSPAAAARRWPSPARPSPSRSSPCGRTARLRRPARRGRRQSAGPLCRHRRRGAAVPAQRPLRPARRVEPAASCGWWSCSSPASRSSAMSPTAFSASATGPSPPR